MFDTPVSSQVRDDKNDWSLRFFFVLYAPMDIFFLLLLHPYYGRYYMLWHMWYAVMFDYSPNDIMLDKTIYG